jgi:eukaryotic-like serine/threonine-protein kinase
MKQKTRRFYSFGPFRLDAGECLLNLDGKPVPLAPKAFEALLMLVENAGHLVDKDDLMRRLWPTTFVEEANVAKYVSLLRNILSEATNGREYIETIPKRGYRFVVEVRDTEEEEAGAQAQTLPGASMTGKKVSHYRVLQVLGGGGMGVVYTAEDLKLGRRVALKFLPEEIVSDAKVLERFEREARATSALDHPNICPIFEFGEQEGRPFIVMPLLDGRNLRDMLADCDSNQGCLFPFQQILELSVQIVSGLQAAHDKGIIHRDIKPANIFITQRGVAKILDFGIAKMIPATESSEGEVKGGPSGEHWTSSTATDQTLSLTRTGIAVGSAGYMSPEQVRGEKLDARTDLFSFGLVLYEMVTGQRAFTGDTAAIVQNAILNQSPTSAKELNRDLPVEVELIITRALEKDRGRRYGSAGEMLADLQATKQETTATPPSRKSKRLWGGIGAAVFLLTAAVIWRFTPVPLPRVTGFTQLTSGSNPSYSLFTDGLRLYFHENRTEGRRLSEMSVTGGEIFSLSVPINHPVIEDISPDHSHLLISNTNSLNAPLWILPLPAGSPRRIGDLEASGATYAPDGKHLLFTKDSDVYLAADDGSEVRRIVSGVEGRALFARFSPDGSTIRFNVLNAQGNTITLWELRADGSDLHLLLPGWRGPLEERFSWTPDGRYFVFSSEAANGAHDIFALRESRGFFHKQSGSPIRLTFGPLRYDTPLVSLDGKRLFVGGGHLSGELVRYDPTSRQFVLFLGGISATNVSFSRDGKWITYITIPGYALWRSRVDGSEKMQLTSSSGNNLSLLPHWSPDGRQIAFISKSAEKPWTIFLTSANGGSPIQLLSEDTFESDPTWSADGTQLAFATGTDYLSGKSEIRIVNMNTHQFSTLPGSSGKSSPRWSPNGRYMAAFSFEPHPKKIFLYDFQLQKWAQWATDQDMSYLSWTADSRHVQYLQNTSGDRDPKVRRITIGDSHPQDLFGLKSLRQFDGPLGRWSDTAPDGSQMFVRDASGRDIYALDVEFP